MDRPLLWAIRMGGWLNLACNWDGFGFFCHWTYLQHHWLQMLPAVSSFLCGAQGTGAFLWVPASPSTFSRPCPSVLHRKLCSRQGVGRLLLLVCGARPVVGGFRFPGPASVWQACLLGQWRWGFLSVPGAAGVLLCLWGSGVGGSLLPLPREHKLLLLPQPQLWPAGSWKGSCPPSAGQAALLPLFQKPRICICLWGWGLFLLAPQQVEVWLWMTRFEKGTGSSPCVLLRGLSGFSPCPHLSREHLAEKGSKVTVDSACV